MTPTPYQIFIWLSIAIIITILILIIRYWRKKKIKKMMDREDVLALSENGIRFKTLDAFMMHLPDYCIKEDIASKMIRKTMESLGAEFQKRVFIDTEGGKDKALYLRKKSNIFINEKGGYLDPRFYTKDIVYHFKHDLRPVIDMANDDAWINPEMNSRFFCSALNTTDMNARKKNDEMMLYIGLAVVGLLIISIILNYTAMTQESDHYRAVYNYLNYFNQTISNARGY